MKTCLAIDIGASSGRHILGEYIDGELKTREVYRFPNGVTKIDGHLTWDIEALENYVRIGIDEALKVCDNIASLSIDTWGVDYVLLNGDAPILPVYAYRDSITEESIPLVHDIIPFSTLYRHTGCQFQPFNTIYQLYHDKINGRLENATDFMMIPEYLMYRLCGNKSKEFTNATTTGMISAETLGFDEDIIEKLGLPKKLFPKLSMPGTVIGNYRGIDVMLCATHDTGSAVEGIPMEGDNLYISSGTWSLLGAKTTKPITDEKSERANYSNEGGIGYNRYQKNIMGMWLANELHRELMTDLRLRDIDAYVLASDFNESVDANSPEFLAPESMKQAFEKALGRTDLNPEDYFRCAYRSLAKSYKQAIDEIEANTGKTYETIYIVGGGAKNKVLNAMTEEETGKIVRAIPIEATAIGNLTIQLKSN